MKVSKENTRYLRYAILIISICLIMGAISACLPFNINLQDNLEENAIDNTAMTITTNPSDGLGEFNDGYSYVYTDKDLIDKYRAVDPNTPFDITTQKVAKTSSNRGTKENPYVIESVDDWETFVKFCGIDLANSTGKYFVLAKDLDFDGKDFHPVGKFGGNFYGVGHKLLNINCDNWQYWAGNNYASISTTGNTSSGFGVFCNSTNAVITDLTVENFSYSNIVKTTAGGVGGTYGPYVGGVVGVSFGKNYILNCHIQGAVEPIHELSVYPCVGGIVGTHTINGANKTLVIYRCSGELDLTIKSPDAFVGGIIGQTFYETYVYDCAVNFRVKHTGDKIRASVVLGWQETPSEKLVIADIVGSVDIMSSVSNYGGALVGSKGGNNINNCFLSGYIGTSAKKSIPNVAGGTTASITSASNVHYAKPYALASGSSEMISSNAITAYTGDSAVSDMIFAAKTFLGNSQHHNIWDTSKIGGLYDPDNSPVRNYLLAFVNYRNLTNDGSSEESVGIEDGLAYLPDADLESQPGTDYMAGKPSNQVFLGWTDDKTGKSEPFTKLPSGMFGEVTLYAVWGLSDDYIANYINPTLSTDKEDADPTKNNVITYDSKTSIKLTAKVEHTATSDGMTDPTVNYCITQTTSEGTKERATNTTGILSVKTVADSGEYTYTYRITDKNQPLWFYDGKLDSSKNQTLTINKGKVSIAKDTSGKQVFTLTQTPYIGRLLSELTFTVKAVNSAGIEVDLKFATDSTDHTNSTWWANTVGVKVIDENLQANKDAGKDNTYELSLYPVDTDNYERFYKESVTFESKTMYLTFVFRELTQELKVPLAVYGDNYYSRQIIADFNTVYLDAVATNPAFSTIGDSGMAPYLADEEEIEADPTYKGAPIVADSSGKALYNRDHNNVREEFSIYVFFNAVTYMVTFDSDGADNDVKMPAPESYGYGISVKYPDEDPVKGELLFVGWYFDTTDDSGKAIRRAWRFFDQPQEDGTVLHRDRVSGNLTLKAEWLSATDLESVTFEISNTAVFEAQSRIDSDDYLTVTAHYFGTKTDGSGETVTAKSDKIIPYGKYVIEYGEMLSNPTSGEEEFDASYSTLKVVEGGMYVRVGVMFKGNYVYSTPQKITVTPIDKSDLVKDLTFGTADGVMRVEYDGSVHKLNELSDEDIKTMTSRQVTGVKYVYRDAYTNEVVDEPTEMGEYNVTVTFETSTPDFYVKPMEFKLTIVSTIKVKVEWENNSLMYTGGAQYPKIVKILNADTGAEISINESQITYSGDLEATAINMASKRYKVKVTLGDLYTIVEGEECIFDIVKALLEIPTYTAGMIMYDGTTKVLEDCLGESFNPLLMEIISNGTGKEVGTYKATIKLKDTVNCSWADNTITAKQIEWKIEPAILYVNWDEWEFVDDGSSAYAPKISELIGLVGTDSFDYDTDFVYKIYDENGEVMDGITEVSEIGSYKIVANFNGTFKNYVLDTTSKEWSFVVAPRLGMTVITIEWGETQFVYDGEIHYPTPTIKDKDGNDVTNDLIDSLKFSEGYYKRRDMGTYTVKVTLNDSLAEEYFIRAGATCKYKITDKNGHAPSEEETNEMLNSGNEPGPGNGGSGIDFDSILQGIKEYWQAIVSGVCIILIIAFLAKAASYEGRRKRANKTAEERYKSYYAAVGLFGWAATSWTVIACVFIGLAVASLAIMLIAKSRCTKAEDSLAYAKEDFERNQMDVENRRREEEARQRDENMRMMLMSMFGGNAGNVNMGQGMPQGAYMGGGGYGLGVEEMRGLISETVSALLPGMQQMLPQQASTNDELVQKLIDQNEKLMEKSQKNEEEMRDLIKKLAEKPAEKVVEKEVASASVNDETIKQIMKNQETLMERILELSANQSQPQVVEKVIEKEVPVEKIVEKVVEVPVEKIVEVPVEVEKVVEKEVKVEVPVEVEKIVEKEVKVEVPVEVEKIVEKEVRVEVPVEKIVEVPVPVISTEAEKSQPIKKSDKTPKLTLDEAYAKLSKTQQKYFDSLREYALTKDKCKEKKSTYFILFGQSSVNPLVKLTIKKDTTVALFKMEDEYMKDIRRDATGDGTKIKVKETEVVISDAQACKAAKNMIDLREDQIERYADLLKEQRSMKNKK